MDCTFLIIGGGIAGVTCSETLAFLEPEELIILVSESSLIKTVTNLYAITKTLTHFDVAEEESTSLSNKYTNITVINDTLREIVDTKNYIRTSKNKIIKYKFLCLCMGAVPKLIPQSVNFSEILGIRDTDSVETFVEKLKNCKKIIIVGNGGIATELIHKITGTEVHWVIKDKHITATFIDPGAAEFFQPSLNKQDEEKPVTKRMRYKEGEFKKSGAALGPDWYQKFVIKGSNDSPSSVKIHYETEILNIFRTNNSLEVILSNNEKVTCDLVISATGVTANKNYTSKTPFIYSNEGFLDVNEFMQTNIPNIFAAGDICNPKWDLAKHWFPMKLWTQARQMGCYAAKCLSAHSKNEIVLQDFCFEMFAHSTKLFGYKVILLGLYNGQKLDNKYEVILRMTKGLEYIKFVMENGKLQGAVLIGDTDLEEMCENLILNQLDLTSYGEDILNPDIDIEDYFD